jgi:CRISPR/Cas system-associated endoribonuclease Cas2
MLTIVAYDITDDRRLQRIAKIREDLGQECQRGYQKEYGG